MYKRAANMRGDGEVCLFAENTSVTLSGSLRDESKISNFVEHKAVI